MTTPTTVNVRLQLRADTAANWTAANPILLANEVGLETDTKKLKVGNGSTAWNSLAYFPSIVSGGTVLGNLEIGSTGTLTFEGSTADGFETTLAVTNPTADRTITLPNQSGTVVVSGNASIVDADIAANAEIAVSKLADGAARQLLQTDAAGTGVEWTSNVDIPGTLDVTGTATFDGAVTVAGDLTVNGTTTTISTQNLLVEDKNIIIGDVATPTDVTADGGGITLKGATDKTINWVDSTDAWTSSERFSVPLGSAAAPSLTFTGDENTGIYSPGADQVAISTGGSGRLFVDASGRVGIGSSTIGIAYTTTLTGDGSSIVGGLQLSNNGNTAYIGATTATSADFEIYNSANGYLRFATNNTERLRITSAGLVGIGTTSPGAALSIGDTSTTASNQIRLHGPASGTAGGSSINVVNGINTVFAAGNASNIIGGSYSSDAMLFWGNADLRFYGNSSERARIDSSGRLGLGTSLPTQSLSIGGSGATLAGTAAISLFDGNSGASRRWSISNGAGGNAIDLLGKLVIGYSSTVSSDPMTGTAAVVIDSSGRVGIGTTSPGYALHVVGTINSSDANIGFRTALTNGLFQAREFGGSSANNTLEFNIRPDSGKSGYLTFTETSVADRWSIGIQNGSDGLRFISGTPTTGTERCRIDGSGRLLVGTSSQSGGALLQVNGDRVRIATAKTPASATDTGTAGEICWDASYVYVCTAANTWKRSALTTW